MKRVQEFLKYKFSTEELAAISMDLARATQDLQQVAAEKKRASADFKSREEAANANIGRLAANIREGYDMRMLDCSVIFNCPGIGMKTVVRVDTGEIVREMRMSENECQMELPMEAAAEPTPEPEPEPQAAPEPEPTRTEANSPEPPAAVDKPKRGRPRKVAEPEPEPAPVYEDENQEAFPDVDPVYQAAVPIPTDPASPEWRTAEEIRAGVPRFVQV